MLVPGRFLALKLPTTTSSDVPETGVTLSGIDFLGGATPQERGTAAAAAQHKASLETYLEACKVEIMRNAPGQEMAELVYQLRGPA